MRLFLLIVLSTLSISLFSQDPAKAKQEILQLLTALNEARMSHNRQALEKIYADEFMAVHSAGYTQNKTEVINEIMETDSIRALPPPSLDNFFVYGNTVVLRQPVFATSATVASGRAM